MRTGIVLPTFRNTPDEAFAAAKVAVAAGVDGLFCYDHIWPIGQPAGDMLALSLRSRELWLEILGLTKLPALPPRVGGSEPRTTGAGGRGWGSFSPRASLPA